MRLEEFTDLDEQAFSEVLNEMLAVHPNPAVRRVAEEHPGLYIEPIEGDKIRVYLLELGDHRVDVGTIHLDAIRRSPRPSPN
jgi:hypothetical protein